MNDGFSEAARSVTPAATAADTRRHLIECLARAVNSMSSKADRQDFLQRFAKGKPASAVQELKDEMLRQWRSK